MMVYQLHDCDYAAIPKNIRIIIQRIALLPRLVALCRRIIDTPGEYHREVVTSSLNFILSHMSRSESRQNLFREVFTTGFTAVLQPRPLIVLIMSLRELLSRILIYQPRL
jgi:hypothetical protein